MTSSTPIETPSSTAAAGARRGALRQRWLDVVTPLGGAIHGQRALLISSRARLLRARHVRSSSRARRDAEHAIETPSREAAAGARRARSGALRQRWLDVVTPLCGAIHGQRALLISSRARLLRARHVRSSSRARRDAEHADRDATPHGSGRRSQRLHTRAVARFGDAAQPFDTGVKLTAEDPRSGFATIVLDTGVAHQVHAARPSSLLESPCRTADVCARDAALASGSSNWLHHVAVLSKASEHS